MPFQYILANLLADNDGAAGVLFLDDAGETVDLASAELSPYDLRILGAYLGIHLRRLDRLMTENRLGEPRMIHLQRGGVYVYAVPLPEGYHVALVQRRPAVVARARRSLARAAEQLAHELFAA